MLDGGWTAHEDRIVASAAAYQECFEIGFQSERGFVRLPRFADHCGAGVGLGVRIEPMDHRRAPARVFANFQMADEILVQPGEATAFRMKRREAFCPCRC